MKSKIIVLLAVMFFFGCAKKSTVPDVEDVHNIVVNGQHYTAHAFVVAFCQADTSDKTCMKVALEARKQSSRAGTPARF